MSGVRASKFVEMWVSYNQCMRLESPKVQHHILYDLKPNTQLEIEYGCSFCCGYKKKISTFSDHPQIDLYT